MHLKVGGDSMRYRIVVFFRASEGSGKEAASLPLPPLRTGLDGFHHPAQAVCKLCRGQNR
jgi:hypothetical protein